MCEYLINIIPPQEPEHPLTVSTHQVLHLLVCGIFSFILMMFTPVQLGVVCEYVINIILPQELEHPLAVSTHQVVHLLVCG